MRLRAILWSLLAVALIPVAPETHALAVNQVVFSDQTYADANWTIVNSFGLVAAGQQATGGNPGSYRQVALFGGIPFVGQVNNTFVYNPSVQGAITGITYNMDLETLNAAGASYFALLAQNGNFYIDNVHGANGSANTWLNQNVVLNLADFALLQTTPGVDAFVIDRTSLPDFSAGGSAITFGYEAVSGGAGSFLSITGIDNDPITLTVTPPAQSPVPEPSTLLLFGAGLVGFGFMGKRFQK